MNQKILITSAFILLMSMCGHAFATQDINPDDDKLTVGVLIGDEDNQPGGMFHAVINGLDITHSSISSKLEKTAISIDSFFADNSAFEQTNNSYMRIALDMVYKKYDGFGFAGDLKLKVDLPHTKKRLKLLIETDSQRDLKDNLEALPANVVQERDFFISLERKLSGAKRWDIRPSLGIKINTPIDLFTRMRTFRYFTLDHWLLRASSNLAWYDSRGFGANGVLAFDREIRKGLIFRAASKLNWQEEEMFRHFSQTLTLYQRINERQNIAYQIAGFADDEMDWQSNKYYMRVRYRKRLYKKWMFGEIIPQLTFLKENGFRNESSITFRLEMVFGERYR